MKSNLVILFFLFTVSIFAQKNKSKCSENIYFEEINNNLTLYLKDKKINYIEPINLIGFKSCKITILCKENYIDLIYTFQNGNEYKIVNNIFKTNNKDYYLDKTYIKYTNRSEVLYTGFISSAFKIEDFVIQNDLFNKDTDEKEISQITNIQEGEEKENINYLKLVKKSYKNKKYNDVLLLTNEFVIDELNIVEKLKADELNDISYFAYKSKGYNESIYILNEVIEKSPNRVVAYLNIADCYWEINKKEKSKENYEKYIQLMKKQKKDLKKIPKYVYDRLKKS
jgi:hypothetical protein